MEDVTLGQKIARQRKLLRLSQEAFGERMGVSRQAISKWEADASIPEIDKLIHMSKLFGVSVGWLLGTEEAAVVPTPAKEPLYSPEQEKRRRSPWTAVCLGAAALSLVASVLFAAITMQRTKAWHQENRARLEALEGQTASAQAALEEADMQLQKSAAQLRDARKQMEAAQQRLDCLLGVTDQPEGELPAYEGLARWSMEAAASADLSEVTVTFTAVPDGDTRAIRFAALREEQEPGSVLCEEAGGSYTASLTLPALDGYEYRLILEKSDGTQAAVTLREHGLSDLGQAAAPRLGILSRSPYDVENNRESFWVWEEIMMNIPRLVPADAACRWESLRVSYYYNDTACREQMLTREVNTAPTSRLQSIELTGQTWEMERFREGDRHTLCLEGTLSVNGVSKPFSLPINRWVISGGEMMSY